MPSASSVWIGEVSSHVGGEKEIVASGAYGFQNNISPFLQKVIKQQNWNMPCAEIQVYLPITFETIKILK